MEADAIMGGEPAGLAAVREGVFMDGEKLRAALARVPDAHRDGIAQMLNANWALGTDAVRRFLKGDVGDGFAFMHFCSTLMRFVQYVAGFNNDVYYFVTYACLDSAKRSELFGAARYMSPAIHGGALTARLTIGDVRRDATLRRLVECEFVSTRSVKRRVVPLLHFTRRKLGEVFDNWQRLVSATTWQPLKLPEDTRMDAVALWCSDWFRDVCTNMKELFRAAVARDDAWRDYETQYRYVGIPFDLSRLDSKTHAHNLDALYSDVAYVVRHIHVPLTVTTLTTSAFTSTVFAPAYYRYDTRSGAARWGVIGGPTFFRQYTALRRGKADVPFTVRCCAGLTQLQQLQAYMRLLCVHPDDYLILGHVSRLCFSSRARRNRLALTKLMDAPASADAWPLTRLQEVNFRRERVNPRRGAAQQRSVQSPVQTWTLGAAPPAAQRDWLLCAEAAVESEWARRSYAVINKPYVCDAAALADAHELPALELAALVEPQPLEVRHRLQLLIELKRRQTAVAQAEGDAAAAAAAAPAPPVAAAAPPPDAAAAHDDDVYDVGAYDDDMADGTAPAHDADMADGAAPAHDADDDEPPLHRDGMEDVAEPDGAAAAAPPDSAAAGPDGAAVSAARRPRRQRTTPAVVEMYFLRSHVRSAQDKRQRNRTYLSILDDSYRPKRRPRRK